jgi:LPS sulfotransferase NodH
MVSTAGSRKYIICTTARSGSNLLCNYLANTHRLGRPGEMLNPDMVRSSRFGRELPPGTPVSTRAYLDWLRAIFSSPAGIFGIKLLHEDLETFSGFPALQDLFEDAQIYLLRRRSKLKQAISYYFAEKTGQWVATDKARMPIEDVPFDFARIEQHLRRLSLQDTGWITHLDAARLDYREVIFEDFLKAPGDHLAAIARDLGIDPDGMPVEATLHEQKNAISAMFAERFSEAFRARAFTPRESTRYKGMDFVA